MFDKESSDTRMQSRKQLNKSKSGFKVIAAALEDQSVYSKNKLLAYYCRELCNQYIDDIDSLVNGIDWYRCQQEHEYSLVYDRKLQSMKKAVESLDV